jgi:hypothetical protein
LTRTGAPATPSGDDDQTPAVLWSGEVLAFETARRIEQFDAVRFRPFLQVRQIVRITAEREMM